MQIEQFNLFTNTHVLSPRSSVLNPMGKWFWTNLLMKIEDLALLRHGQVKTLHIWFFNFFLFFDDCLQTSMAGPRLGWGEMAEILVH